MRKIFAVVLSVMMRFSMLCLVCLNDGKNKVEASIIDGTLSNIGFRYTMENTTQDCVFTYGNDFAVQRWSLFTGWKEYHGPQSKTVFAVLHMLEPGKLQEYGINWESVYGELESGMYRFVKTIERSDGSSYQLRLYFTI